MKLAEETVLALIAIGISIPLLLLWIVTLVDIARRRDLSITKKIGWGLVVILGLYIGIAVYFIMRPVKEVDGKGLDHTVPETSAVVNNLESLHLSHSAGSVSDDDYIARKRDLLGLT